MLEVRELLTGFMVTTVADNGDNSNPTTNSLRAAILAADADSTTVGAYPITFDIAGGGVQAIDVPTSLPGITRGVAINGISQPGYAGTPLIVIDGSGAGAGASGLTFSGGTGSRVQGLAIVGFATNGGAGGAAIDLQAGSSDALIEGNYLGIEPDGSTAKANYYGIVVASSSNTIGGSIAATRDVISGNTAQGVFLIGGATGNLISGDYIGTDATGNNAVGNLDGVALAASGNVVGGTMPGTGNLISGNSGPQGNSGIGVLFESISSFNLVEGNEIGTNVAGTSGVANAYGVYFGNQAGTTGDNLIQDTVGGTVAGAGNLISGNYGVGIAGVLTIGSSIGGRTGGALIAGNTIGLGSDGSSPVPNGVGIVLNASFTTIGGSTAGAGNVISGNGGGLGLDGSGLELSGISDLILGNDVGLDASGAGSSTTGNVVGMILNLVNSTIGGTSLGAGNVISGNSGDAIELTSKAQDGGGLGGNNDVIGNVIGLTRLGAALPNGGNGISLTVPAPTSPAPGPLALDDTIGGTAAGAGNTIAGCGGDGIVLNDRYPTGITGLGIRGNTVYGNAGLGMDLSGNAVGVPIQSTLFVTADGLVNGQLEVVGVFFGVPSTSYSFDLFAGGADSSGYGQGQVYLGSVTVVTNLSGFALLTPSFAPPSTPYTSFTATYTGSDGNTSEFAANFPTAAGSPRADLTVLAQSSSSTVVAGGPVTFTETVINDGPNAASNVFLVDTLPTSLVNAAVTTTAGTATIDANNVLIASLGSLASGQSVTVRITVDASQPGVFFDSPGVSSTTFDPTYDNNQAQQSITVQPSGSGPLADLAITEVASPSPAPVGANLTYVVTVTNGGPNIATNVTINDFLPPSVTFISAIPSQGAPATLNGTYLADNLGTIAIGGSATFTIVVVPRAAGTIVNAANVSGNQFDTVTSNNSTSLAITVGGGGGGGINLALSQTASASPGLVGGDQTFVLQVANLGTGPATNVTVVDTLPANVTVVGATPSQGGPASIVNGFLVDDLGTLAPGASATITLIVVPNAPGLLVNGAGVYTPDVPSFAPAFANNGVISVPSGPSVVGIVGHANNSSLIITFDEPLTSYSATTKANYKLYALGKNGTSPPQAVAITGAAYNSSNDTVTITPAAPLDPVQYYQIQVIGSTAAGITDIYGRKLVNPRYGAPGANFAATFFAGTFPQA